MLKRNIYLILTILFAGGFVGLRTYELLYWIDPANGFFRNEYLTRGNIVSWSLIAAIAVLIVLAIAFCRGYLAKAPYKTKSIPMGIVSFLYGIGLLVDIGLEFSKTNSVTLNADFVLTVLNFIIAILFFVYGFARIKNFKFPGGLVIVPIAVSAYELILNYTRFNGLSNVTEYLVDIILMAFVMGFWLFHAHICTNNMSRRSRFWGVAFGSVTFIFALLSTVPRFIVNYLNSSLLSTHSGEPKVASLMLAFYAIVFIGSVLTVKKESVTTSKAVNNETYGSDDENIAEDESIEDDNVVEDAKLDQSEEFFPDGIGNNGSSRNITPDEIAGKNNNLPPEPQKPASQPQPANNPPSEKSDLDDDPLDLLEKSSDDILNDIINNN